MKKTLFALLIFGLASNLFSFAQTGALTIKPEKPKIGDEITISYTPALSQKGLTDVSNIVANILVINDMTPELKELNMQKSGGTWKTSFKLADTKSILFAIRFTSGEKTDDNNGDVWRFMVYTQNDKPAKNACLNLSSLYKSGEMLGFKVKKSAEESKALLEKELAAYPENVAALSTKWGVMAKENKGEATTEKIKNELLTAYHANRTDEKAIITLLRWFDQTGLEKRGKDIKDSILVANPGGSLALTERMNKVFGNRNSPDLVTDIQKVMVDFPAMPASYRSSLNNLLITTLVKAKEYTKVADFLAKENNQDGGVYNTLAWPLIEKGENLELAVSWAKKGVDLLRNPDPKNKPSYMTAKEWKENNDGTLGMILDTYGFGLEQMGKNTEALKAYEESYNLTKGDEDGIVQHYVQSLVTNGDFKKATEISEAALEKEKANDATIVAYKKAYLKLKGTDTDVDAIVAKYKTKGLAARMETMKKEMLNKPAPDFNLKDFDGNYVKLSDLKGKVVVVDFWATWCGPCKASFPALQKVYEKYKSNPNIVILALDTWEKEKTEADKEKKVKDFIAQNNYTFKVLFDTDVVTKYEVTGIPTKFVVDKDGMIQFKTIGFSGEQKMISELDAQFELLLNK